MFWKRNVVNNIVNEMPTQTLAYVEQKKTPTSVSSMLFTYKALIVMVSYSYCERTN